MSRLAAVRIALLLLPLMGLVYGIGCNSHLLTNPDAGPQIGDRGISVPVPPPSLQLMPVQFVDIEGKIGATEGGPGVRVFLEEIQGGLDGRVDTPEADGSFLFEGVELDLTNNCIDVWTEDDDGQESLHSFFRASIDADDQSVLTVQLFNGCP